MTRMQINFQVRDLIKGGDALFMGYLSELFKFTTASYKSNNASIVFVASKLNNVWQRIYLESMGLGLNIKDHLIDFMQKVSEAYIDGNLAVKSMSAIHQSLNGADGSDADDEDEHFDKGQRTLNQENFDHFSRLLKMQIVPSLNLVLTRVNYLVG